MKRAIAVAWTLIVVAMLGTASPAAADDGAAPPTRQVALLEDPQFRRGLTVLSPVDGQKTPAGELRPFAVPGVPAWTLAQWHSRFSLAGAAAEQLPKGAVRFHDAAKAVTFGPAGESDLLLALNAQEEYGHKVPASGDAWPHLLVEQPLAEHPRLADLESLRLQLEYRIVRRERLALPDWDEHLHTAQFQCYLTIQNQPKDPALADYYWFGVPLFDLRHRMPEGYAELDFSTAKKAGTGKFIFLPAAARLYEQSAHDGQWVHVDVDLLPFLVEGLKLAWSRGFLANSHDVADYVLGSLNLGWEVTGPVDAVAEVRNLRLTGTVRAGKEEK